MKVSVSPKWLGHPVEAKYLCLGDFLGHSWCVGRVSVIFHVRLTVHSSNLGHLLCGDKAPNGKLAANGRNLTYPNRHLMGSRLAKPNLT